MKNNQEQDFGSLLIKFSNLIGLSALTTILLLFIVVIFRVSPTHTFLPDLSHMFQDSASDEVPETIVEDEMWKAPDLASLPATPEGDQIKYGHELVKNTAQYLGPEGSVLHISNGMNCQNCHLDAGTKPFGNNYALVASTYPKVRARSGMEEDVTKRVTDCFERSLNGTAPDKDSKEMQAMVAYIQWVGKDVKKGDKVKGSGLINIEMLDRAASPELGKAIYIQKCQVCHGTEGEGMKPEGSAVYVYPPLWGGNSYNDGAGLYRISNFAKYVKANMPLGATYDKPQLSDEEAWDIAAFVNSKPRPTKDISNDWPDISKKPFDHPFGPFTDNFSEHQHKYGPFKAIIEVKSRSK
ncbi:c-type cytochrome [Pontibacter sp. Tf4]|uniref:c-type cytochrome n=1 Tax=Pontibacter sp. Tf4 TaxID=2761620 RepID=UPI001628734A|nr:c-type cytochrome [Pontibacter sp. Tf4]MBB6610540.1 c-type cytochrome [Pontibacter sp. Tf4]